jgi:hypothetical protein
MITRLSRVIARAAASPAWFWAHALAIGVLTWLTLTRGEWLTHTHGNRLLWFWIFGPALMVSYLAGYLLYLREHAAAQGRRRPGSG